MAPAAAMATLWLALWDARFISSNAAASAADDLPSASPLLRSDSATPGAG